MGGSSSFGRFSKEREEGKHNEWNQLSEVDGMSLCAADGR